MTTSVAVVCFPGSNCEHDVVRAVHSIGGRAHIVWHGDTRLDRSSSDADRDVAAVILPGGFAHGDYLRTGAIARFSPIMDAVREFAAAGRPVVGICNGFQILTEAGLLPGALRRNSELRFICTTLRCTVASNASVLTRTVEIGRALALPVNHGEGNYTCDDETLAEIEANGQVVLRYEDNPNGSVHSIAGVANRAGNVVGLMPHPERASDALLGSDDGLVLLRALLASSAEDAAPTRPAARSAAS